MPLWERELAPRLAGRPCRALEVGALEGRATLWMLEHLLQHPRSRVVCLDEFRSAGAGGKEAWVACSQGEPRRVGDVWAAFQANVMRGPGAKKAAPLRGPPADTLRGRGAGGGAAARRLLAPASFDLVTIDPPGSARSALELMVLAFPLLKPGGVMVVDDYTWSKEHDGRCPRGGVDAFLAAYAQDVRVVHAGWQVVLERRAEPLPLGRCLSEYYPEPRPGKLC